MELESAVQGESRRSPPFDAADDGGETGVKRLKGADGEAMDESQEDVGKRLVDMVTGMDAVSEEKLEEQLRLLVSTLIPCLQSHEAQIIDALSECASYLPEKLTIFTTLLGIINSESAEFAKSVVNRLVTELEDSFDKERYEISVRLVTFLCDLANAKVVTVGSVMDFLDSLAQVISAEGVKSDFFVYLILHSLPWIGSELQERRGSELNELLKMIESYLGKRKKLHINMLQVWSSGSPHPQEDYLDSLWTQIVNLKKNQWRETHILRLYGCFQTTLNTATQHDLPPIDLSTFNSSTKSYPLPRVVFRLFDPTDCIEMEFPLPPADSIERFLLEEDLNWIIDNNYLNCKLAAQTILDYHRRELVPLNYSIVEVVFGQLFRLPYSPHLELFYGALLIELCRLRQDTMPQVLAIAVEFLYRRADSMQPLCVDRFVNWFSYHLSNFQYLWAWTDWADCIDLDTLHPRLIFVREVIEKCLRFSYYKRIVDFLPDKLDPIIPAEPEISYELNDVNNPAYELASRFHEAIMSKKTDEEILPMLKSEPQEGEEDGGGGQEYDPDSVAVFTAVLLKIASKTFSHSFAALTKYHQVFRAVCSSEEMQSMVLRVLYECWNRHKQMMTVLVDKMLKMQIVEPTLVEQWVFSDEMRREFKRLWVWDVLSIAINRLEGQYDKLEGACQKLAGMVEAMVEEMDETGDELKHPKVTAPAGAEDTSEGGAFGDEFAGKSRSDIEKELGTKREKLEETRLKLRAMILSICHRFTLLLSEHLVNCESDGTEVETEFYLFVLGRLRYIFMQHFDSVWRFVDDLERELFSPTLELDPRIIAIFKQFQSLKL